MEDYKVGSFKYDLAVIYDPKTENFNDRNLIVREVCEETNLGIILKKDFETRSDGVLPYSKEIIIKHIKNRLKELK